MFLAEPVPVRHVVDLGSPPWDRPLPPPRPRPLHHWAFGFGLFLATRDCSLPIPAALGPRPRPRPLISLCLLWTVRWSLAGIILFIAIVPRRTPSTPPAAYLQSCSRCVPSPPSGLRPECRLRRTELPVPVSLPVLPSYPVPAPYLAPTCPAASAVAQELPDLWSLVRRQPCTDSEFRWLFLSQTLPFCKTSPRVFLCYPDARNRASAVPLSTVHCPPIHRPLACFPTFSLHVPDVLTTSFELMPCLHHPQAWRCA